ncbi:MAG: TRAP transporter small permease [Deltaproteobacteria bacterium]|nr:TRAP transporter small permease [Deltaproteobacteria bacterium]MBW2307202.1 TRAP transporter small permease [Deltaproteobacteria bacterium]
MERPWRVSGFIAKLFNNFEDYFCQAMLSIVVCLLGLQIFLRDVFNYNISWGEELARFSFVWFVYLGASYATKTGHHIRVTMQLKIFPKAVQKIILSMSDLIWIALNLVMIKESTMLIASMMKFKYISPTLGWSMAYIYMIFPISFTLMTIRIIQRYYMTLKGRADEEHSSLI